MLRKDAINSDRGLIEDIFKVYSIELDLDIRAISRFGGKIETYLELKERAEKLKEKFLSEIDSNENF